MREPAFRASLRFGLPDDWDHAGVLDLLVVGDELDAFNQRNARGGPKIYDPATGQYVDKGGNAKNMQKDE